MLETNFINHYRGGSGPDLVLLHGLTGTWRIWQPVIPILEPHHRVIAPTLPGHEGGPRLSEATEPSVAAIADRLIVELRNHGIRTAHVAGNSLGGWLALELARRGFAKSVIAFSPAGGWESPADYLKIARSFRLAFTLIPVIRAATGLFLGSARLRRALARQTMEHADRIPTSEFRAMLRAVEHTEILPALLEAMGRDGPIAPLVASASLPIHILWGGCDQVIPFERYGLPVVNRITGAQHAILPNVGHVPMYDDPEAVGKSILQVTTAGATLEQEQLPLDPGLSAV
jgi:pimeloyl-ACP methyl ester carboxylesterase